MIHRDIKPENIMFTGPDRQLLKVLDFGIAQIGDNKEGGLTTAGAVIGSAPYLAPERWRGEPGTVRSDLYALGCVLYELFTGVRPFSASGTYALMVQHVDEPPPRPTALPRDLARLLLELLAKDPAERPTGAGRWAAGWRRPPRPCGTCAGRRTPPSRPPARAGPPTG